ncbi:MAG: hypothetical protein IT186_05080 [Acidobacteria bacterium]|nr:hypothetical protein [Acidobacteriota bacterium]MCG3195340.1 hypothetical protein [Thermoanaerobaculia bacterium]MCK6681046.1 hypothetical protein [Thermoanaerobaculia bacterium]
MTLSLDIPPDLEERLKKEAAVLGLSPGEFAVRVLSTTLRPRTPRTPDEIVDYWQAEGLLGSRTDIVDSAEHARQIRREAEHRSRG